MTSISTSTGFGTIGYFANASVRFGGSRTAHSAVAAGNIGGAKPADASSAADQAAVAFVNALRQLSVSSQPSYTMRYVRGVSLPASIVRDVTAPAYRGIASTLRTTEKINTQTSTAQTSSRAIGLDLSAGAASVLKSAKLNLDNTSPLRASVLSSSGSLGLDITSPERASALTSSSAIGLDLVSPERASVLSSSGSLGLDITSPERASVLSSSASLGLDITSPERASVLKSSAAISLDVTSAERASQIQSTGEMNTSATSLSSYDVNITGGIRAQFSGTYSGTASTLRVKLNGLTSIGTSSASINADLIDNQNRVVGNYTGNVVAGQAVAFGSSGVQARFTSGFALFGGTSDATTVSQTPTTVNAGAAFNGAWGTAPIFENFQVVTAGSFTLNGTSISVAANDTINSVVARINGAVSGITAVVSADRVIITTNNNSEDQITLAGDTSGFLAATKLASASTAAGNIRDDRPVLSKTSQFGAVTDGSFTINGTSIAVNKTTDSFSSIVSRINGANAGVTAAYDSAQDRLTLTTLGNTEDQIVSTDTTGFLSAAKLATANTVRGNLRDDQQVLAKTSQFGSVATGSFKINGVSIAVNKDTDSVSSLISRINTANAGVTAAFDSTANKLVLTGTANSEDAVSVTNDTSGFLTAAKWATANTVLGNLRDDQQLLAKTSQFAAVTTGSFKINGVSIAVDKDTDTVTSLVSRINTANARVTAAFDSTANKLVLTGTANSEDDIAVTNDTSGFLSAVKWATANTVHGNLRDDQQALAKTSQFGAVTNGAFTINGTSISLNTATDTFGSIVARINSANAGVTAAYDSAQDRLTLTTLANTEDEIALTDSTGFLSAARLAAANTVRGNLRDDQQALAKVSQFNSVATGSFQINGVSIALNKDADTVSSVISRINSANAGVTAAFDSTANKFVLAGTTNSEDDIVVTNDTTGFLAAAKWATANTVRGNIPDDQQVLAKTSQFGSVNSGAFTINGVSIAVDRSTDNFSTLVSRINSANAGVTATYDSTNDRLVLSGQSASEDQIAVANDSTGFLAAAGLASSSTTLGNIPDDQQLLGKTSQFSGVANGSFKINGVSVSVDRTTDTFASVIDRINNSGAGVHAAYDNTTDKLSLTPAAAGATLTLSDDTSGFLGAVNQSTGAWGTHVNAAAAFNGSGASSALLDPSKSVHAGGFTINGTRIDVTASDSITSMVAKINASHAGVQAAYDDNAQTLSLVARKASDAAIAVGNDTSGFVSAMKLDHALATTTGENGSVAVDTMLSKLPSFAGVKAGAVVINGVSLSVNPATTTVRDFITRVNAVNGVSAKIDGSRVSISADHALTPINVTKDTSGLWAALGGTIGSVDGVAGPNRVVKIATGNQITSNASKVTPALARAFDTLNLALDLTNPDDGETAVRRTKIENNLTAMLSGLTARGIDGLSLKKVDGTLSIAVDNDKLTASLTANADAIGSAIEAIAASVKSTFAGFGRGVSDFVTHSDANVPSNRTANNLLADQVKARFLASRLASGG